MPDRSNLGVRNSTVDTGLRNRAGALDRRVQLCTQEQREAAAADCSVRFLECGEVARVPVTVAAFALVGAPLVNATTRPIAMTRTRHHGRRSLIPYAWLSESMIAVMPEDPLQSAATRLSVRTPGRG
jgi:hypothetical protein